MQKSFLALLVIVAAALASLGAPAGSSASDSCYFAGGTSSGLGYYCMNTHAKICYQAVEQQHVNGTWKQVASRSRCNTSADHVTVAYWGSTGQGYRYKEKASYYNASGSLVHDTGWTGWYTW
jgi:hypothetical protein